jgi:hypothetical protein
MSDKKGELLRKTTRLLAGMIAIALSLAVHTSQAQETGDTVELQGATAAAYMVPVCTTTQAVDAVIRALSDDDNDAIAALAALGKVYAVDVGTKAKVLGVRGQYGTYVQIRILDGEFKGRRGYVVSTCISR